jgi:hypothetical protein
MASPDGTRAAAEFTVNGTYLATDDGPAGGAGADLCAARGRLFRHQRRPITRVVTYYNLADWMRQVSA